MKHLSIFPWSMKSEPAELLRNAISKRLGYKVFKVYADKGFEPTPGQAILDWGRSDFPRWNRSDLHWLNPPSSVKNSVNKLKSFARFKEAGVNCVPFTTTWTRADQWLACGDWVCARTSIDGYDGAGLFLVKKQGHLPDAHLFTKFIPASREFRAYVFRGETMDLLEKLPCKQGADPHIRTDGNHWEYSRDFSKPNQGYKEEAVKAIKSCGLDFGGVDMLYDGKEWWVLEVNTAPDIAYKTVELFADGVVDWLQSL